MQKRIISMYSDRHIFKYIVLFQGNRDTTPNIDSSIRCYRCDYYSESTLLCSGRYTLMGL